MTNKTETIGVAERDAQMKSVVGWGFLGFFFPLIALLIVYLRIPKISAAAIAGQEDQAAIRLYESRYIEVMKHRQVKATWFGVGLAIFGFFIFMAAMTSTT